MLMVDKKPGILPRKIRKKKRAPRPAVYLETQLQDRDQLNPRNFQAKKRAKLYESRGSNFATKCTIREKRYAAARRLSKLI